MIQIQVRNKVAVNLTPKEIIVCGNSGYEVEFQFDAEWEEALVKTARFVYRKDGKNLSIDQPFTENTVEVPKLSNIHFVMVGVYAGDLKTTTPAVVNCKKSILCGTGKHEEPEPDVYNELIELINTGGASDAIRHSPQELTDEQKEQARENIGAASKKDIDDLDFMPPDGNPEAEVRFDVAHAQMVTAPEFVIADPESSAGSILLTKEGAEEDEEPRKAVMLTDPSGNPVVMSNVADPEKETDVANRKFVREQVVELSKYLEDLVFDETIQVYGAEVGQLLKVKAVDKNGHPTAWETVYVATQYPVVGMILAVAEIQPNTFYRWGKADTLTISLAPEIGGIVNEYLFEFSCGTIATELSLPESVKWAVEPNIEAGKTYQVSILNGLAVIIGA